MKRRRILSSRMVSRHPEHGVIPVSFRSFRYLRARITLQRSDDVKDASTGSGRFWP